MRKIIIYYLPAILYAGLIFVLSSIEKLPGPDFGFDYFDKILHFGEYAIFSYLLVRMLKVHLRDIDHSSIFQITLFIAIAYASFDEFHQSFVPGRDADFLDLVADSSGILVGLGVYFLRLKQKSPKIIKVAA